MSKTPRHYVPRWGVTVRPSRAAARFAEPVMAHTVTFSVPERALGREDIEFVVKRDGVRFGTLLVSKGAVEWRPTNKVYRRRLRWERFDQLMRESGRKV
jgi:hypothetical protein